MTDQPATPTTFVDVEKRVGQYIKLRDLKAEMKEKHESELKPVNETMQMIEDELKGALNAVNVTNMKTDAGTVSLSTKASASAADINAFWTWVITQGAFDMLDKKPNVTAITEYVKANGVAPPGVNYSTYQGIGVRRK
jgi:mannose/fructose/N-acetylgalactosamine-specific phosphotransferase system component IIB